MLLVLVTEDIYVVIDVKSSAVDTASCGLNDTRLQLFIVSFIP